MKYRLHINTVKTEAVSVSLVSSDGVMWEKQALSILAKSQSVLPTIEAIMKEHMVSWNDIEEVSLEKGPGSFTGLRVGATVGATIAWVLGLPINGEQPGTVPSLEYGADKWNLGI